MSARVSDLVGGLRELRLWILIAGAVVALLAITRCNGRDSAEADALAATQRARIATLHAAVIRDNRAIDSLTRVARTHDAPHEAAIAKTQAAERAGRASIEAARAALARDSLNLEEARAIAEEVIASYETLLRLVPRERAAAAARIGAYVAVVNYVELAAPAVDSLVDAQADRIRTLERGRPWWRRALGAACEGLTVGTGAGGGAAIAGPPGAIVGGVGGLVVSALSCR